MRIAGLERCEWALCVMGWNQFQRAQQEIAQLREGKIRQDVASEPDLAPDPHKERERLQLQFAELEQRLESDPLDPSRSREATAYLETDLSGWGQKAGFSLIAAECRTEICRATWSDYHPECSRVFAFYRDLF